MRNRFALSFVGLFIETGFECIEGLVGWPSTSTSMRLFDRAEVLRNRGLSFFRQCIFLNTRLFKADIN